MDENEVLNLLKKMEKRLETIEKTQNEMVDPKLTKQSILEIKDNEERQKAIEENMHLFE